MIYKNTSLNKPVRRGGKPKFILGIDTSGSITVIGVGEKIVAWKSQRNQTNELLPKIDRLLMALEIKPIQLDGVVVNTGPGSFTGLRVGVTVANGFGYGLRLPVLGVSRFDVIEWMRPKTDLIVLDAGRGELFVRRRNDSPKLINRLQLNRHVKSADIVAVEGADLIPKIHELLAHAGTIHIVNEKPDRLMQVMLEKAKLPRKFSQVMPEYIRGANITQPKKK